MRPASVRYLGFESTELGRAYSLSVDGEVSPRTFVIVIPHAAFTSRRVRFQDAPDICFARLQRALVADPAFAPGGPIVVSDDELATYAESQVKRSPERKRRPAPAVEA